MRPSSPPALAGWGLGQEQNYHCPERSFSFRLEPARRYFPESAARTSGSLPAQPNTWLLCTMKSE